MGSETTTGDIESIKILNEAQTRQLPSVSRCTSSHDPSSEPGIPQNDYIPKSKSEGDLSRHPEAISSPTSPDHTPQWSMASTSPTIGLEGLHSPLTSPPVQRMAMGTPPRFDPDRIPASVFSSKPGNASEWSMVSNESLFSIHNSFKYDDWNTSTSPYAAEGKSHELSSLPPVMEVPSNEEASAKSSSVSNFEKEDPIQSPKATRGPSSPRLSNESGQSCKSFAFPVLETDGGRASSLGRMAEEKKPEQQTTQESNAAQESTTGGWFSCFPCCSGCC